jgi:hypothetical protein
MHVPEPSPHPEDVPHISWEIETGTAANKHATVACRSEPRTRCIVPASTIGQQSFATVHVYYHSTRSDTKYAGSVLIGFFGGPDNGHELKPALTVKANSRPISSAVTDVVTTKPGRYSVRISLLATEGSGRSQTLRDDIDVEVRSGR